jgi:hypothetical protein
MEFGLTVTSTSLVDPAMMPPIMANSTNKSKKLPMMNPNMEAKKNLKNCFIAI